MRKMQCAIAAGLVLTFGMTTLGGCAPAEQATEKPVKVVEVMTVKPVPHARRTVLSGAIEARAQTPAAFLIRGRLIALQAAVGDRVAKGQVVARLSPTEQQADVAAAEAAVQAAQSRLANAKATLDRQTALFRQGFTTRASLEAAQTAFNTAQSAAEAAGAQLALAREVLGHTELVASADGIVIRKLAEVGEVVQPGSPVYVIAEDGPRNAVINVEETTIAGWDRNRQVTVAPVADPEATVTARVQEIAPALDVTGTVQVKVAIDADLPLGSPVTVVLEAPPEERVLVPPQTLTRHDGRPAVWRVAADRTVNPVPVTVESYETGAVVISDGLGAGDVVVTAGIQLLYPGQTVEIREAGQ